MLPKINRLTKKKDFELVFKKGESIKNDFLIFKILKNHLKESRFGFIVSKKVSGKATVRNKIKRRLRKAVLNHLKEIHLIKFSEAEISQKAKLFSRVKKSVDLIIITLPKIEKKEFSEIQEVINNFFNKYNI